jgi:hypothetical protein
MNQSKRDRIAARAHEIWEREGRPHDKAEEHWRRAEQEVAREDGGQQMGAPAESTPPKIDTRPAPPIDAAPPLEGAPAQQPEDAGKKVRGKSGRTRRSRSESQQG